MKKVISLITVLILCVALAVPAFATSVGFVPSITAKPAPEIVVGGTTVKIDGTTSEEGTDGEQGEAFVPVVEVKNETKEVVYTAPVVDLVVTAVSQVQDESAAETVVISEEAVETLKEAYDQLNKENVKLSEEAPELVEQMKEQLVAQVAEQVTKQMEEQGATAEEIEAAVAAATETVAADVASIVDTAVVTALFDVSILSEELDEYLSVEGHTIDLTFKADIPEDHHVMVMVYKENKWQTIENVVVNGDGTITCTFAHFCPVAILTVPVVEEKVEEPTEAAPEAAAPEVAPEAAPEAAPETPANPEQTAEGGFAWWWIVLVVVAVVVVAVVTKKSKVAKK